MNMGVHHAHPCLPLLFPRRWKRSSKGPFRIFKHLMHNEKIGDGYRSAFRRFYDNLFSYVTTTH